MLDISSLLSLLEGPIDSRAARLQRPRDGCHGPASDKAQMATQVSSLFDIAPSVKFFSYLLFLQIFSAKNATF